MNRIILITILLFGLLGNPIEAKPGQLPVEIKAESNDSVGRELIFRIKKKIKESDKLMFANNGPRVILHINTIDPIPETPNLKDLVDRMTAFSVTLTMTSANSELYLNSAIASCGRAAINQTADHLIKIIEATFNQYQKNK